MQVMKRRWLFLGGLVGASSVVACILLLPASVAQKQIDLTGTPTWGDFTAQGLSPSQDQIGATKAEASDSERATSVARMGRVLSRALMPPDFADHLLALRGWEGGNVFLVRQRAGEYWLQVTEGVGKVVVEVRRADGGPLLNTNEPLAAQAKAVARDVLSDAMQPRDFHALTGKPGAVAAWATQDTPDAGGLVLAVCRAYGDGMVFRYELREHLTNAQATFARPAPYAFGGELPAMQPFRIRPDAGDPEGPTPPPSEEQGKIHGDLTREELANEAN
jgi:hypothetical protein